MIAEADSDTLRKLIALQMQKIRHSDWRWFENFELNSLLESDDVARISATTWLDVLSMAFGDSFDWNGNGFQIQAPGAPCVMDANVEEIALGQGQNVGNVSNVGNFDISDRISILQNADLSS